MLQHTVPKAGSRALGRLKLDRKKSRRDQLVIADTSPTAIAFIPIRRSNADNQREWFPNKSASGPLGQDRHRSTLALARRTGGFRPWRIMVSPTWRHLRIEMLTQCRWLILEATYFDDVRMSVPHQKIVAATSPRRLVARHDHAA